MEEIALWIVVGMSALLSLAVAGAIFVERFHRRRAETLGKRRKAKIQL